MGHGARVALRAGWSLCSSRGTRPQPAAGSAEGEPGGVCRPRRRLLCGWAPADPLLRSLGGKGVALGSTGHCRWQVRGRWLWNGGGGAEWADEW